MTRYYGRDRGDSLAVRSIDLPGPRTGWIIDDTDDDSTLDTRNPYATRAAALERLAEIRELAARRTAFYYRDEVPR